MDELNEALGKYGARAYRYAEAIVAGEIPGCQLLKAACQRHINDIGNCDAPWVYDPNRAEHVCDFIERLAHVKGEWASRGERLSLQDWQCFSLCVPFGYVYRDDVVDPSSGDIIARQGTRRFRKVYIEVPRKNAKTTISAGVALYLLLEDEEAGAEIYSCATKRDQAKIVFDIARQMAHKAGLDLEVWKRSIGHATSGSFFQPLHAEGSTMDGLNIHASINDEVHAWKRRDVYDAIETATGARSQPMIWNITTAGTNIEGICYSLRGYVVKLLNGIVHDESFFGLIYTIDDGDDWQLEATWRKANPNFGVSVYPLDMRLQAAKAAQVTSDQVTFLTKRLNVWCSAEQSWMNMVKYQKQADLSLKLEDFRGEDCWLGVDLASKRDIACISILFRRDVGGKVHWYNFVRHYLPEAAVADAANAGLYDGWVRAGWIRTTPGTVIDVDELEAETERLANDFFVRELAFDPGHNSTQYGLRMSNKGLVVVEVRPTVLNFSEPMKWFEAYVAEGLWHHNGDPCMTWQVSNVCVKFDAKDNIFPRKEHPDRKIDGPVSSIMALNRAMAADGAATIYDQRGVVTV